MAHIIELQSFSNDRGHLTVIEKVIPFEIRRIFYMYDMGSSSRGNHRHAKTSQAIVCLRGSCTIRTSAEEDEQTFAMDRPDKCLLLEPADWHEIYDFSPDALLLVMASEYFDPDDYVYKR